MKKINSYLINKVQKRVRQGRNNERPERGQVLVIVALSVIVLTAIVGLTVDVGLVYLNHGKLRRAVDAAALAASLQFREKYPVSQIQDAAVEFLVLNGINDPTAIIEICDPNDPDPAICTYPPRKLVRVKATSVVKLTFLSVIGIHETTISASAVSEAASMDVVLVIDTSESMAYDYKNNDPELRDPSQCNPGHECYPFEKVKEAAKAFVGELYIPYDRVAIVTFDTGARVNFSFSNFDSYPNDLAKRNAVLAAIDSLTLVQPPTCPVGEMGDFVDFGAGPCREYQRWPDCENFLAYENGDCDDWNWDEEFIDANGDGTGDQYNGFRCPAFVAFENPESCGTTSIGRGLYHAGNELAQPDTLRKEALWVTILLTDGAANGPVSACPPSTWDEEPYCRDIYYDRHCFNADNPYCMQQGGVVEPEHYDADDYARDMADFIANEQDALIFTIGLGDLVKKSAPQFLFDLDTEEVIVEPGPKAVRCDDSNNEACWGAGEQFLRYAANKVGGGRYYFAPTGNQLEGIFLDIARNLATRLTQ